MSSEYFDNIKFVFKWPANTIEYNGEVILDAYPEYRDEQGKSQKTKHYSHMWLVGDVYNEPSGSDMVL